MDNNTIAPTPSIVEPPQTPKNRKRALFVVLAIVLAAAIGAGGYYLGSISKPAADNSTQKTTVGTAPGNWQPLTSSKKGFPVTSSNKDILTYYSVDKARTISLDAIKINGTGTGASGKGETDPVASPDLRYIAYIGSDGNLWIFSNETEQTKQLTTNGLVSYITSWSPDSKNILYFYDRSTLSTANTVIDGPMPTTVSFKPQVEQGFYQTNIETGTVTPLAALDYVDGYIDNNTLLAKIDDRSDLLVPFEIDSLKANQTTIKTRATFGVGQFNFSRDGKQWTYTDPADKTNPTNGEVRIVFGAYPNAATTVVDTGSWADVQRPIFSPDAKKIAYQRTVGRSGGIPQNEVWVYDVTSGTKKSAGAGMPTLWVDNTTMLIKKYTAGSQVSFMLLNTETKELKPL